MRFLLDALYAERRALAGCFVILVGTPIGRVLAGFTIFAGLLMVELPVSIVASRRSIP